MQDILRGSSRRRRRVLALVGAGCLALVAAGSAQSPIVETTTPIDSPVHALAQTPDGLLWVGTDAGLWRYDGRRAVLLDAPPPRGPRGNRVLALTRDRGGYLWVGTEDGGLHRFDFRRFHFQALPGTAAASYTVQDLLHDPTGRVWIATPEKLMRYERQLGSTGEELPGIAIVDLESDPQETVWAAAESNVYRRRNGFERVTLPFDTGAGTIRALAFRGETTLWLGRDDGLLRLEGELARGGLPLEATRVPEVGPVRTLLRHDGSLWVGLDDGLLRLDVADGVERITRVASREGRAVRCLLAGAGGVLWIGGDDGLSGLVVGTSSEGPTPVPVLLAAQTGGAPLALPAAGRPVHLTLPTASHDSLELDVVTAAFVDAGADAGADPPRLRWRVGERPWTEGRGATVAVDGLPSGLSRIEIQAAATADDGATWGPTVRLTVERPSRAGLWWGLALAVVALTAVFVGWLRRPPPPPLGD